MLDRIFNSGNEQMLMKAMDAANLRSEVIANNIANIDTPGFKKSEVIFSEKIQNILRNEKKYFPLKTTDRSHISGSKNLCISTIQPEIQYSDALSYRNDGNNVDIDVEMAELSKNKIYYDALAQSISKEIKLLRLAITGG